MISSETSYIYAPLAHRLGLYNLMSEMEDITMKFLEPEAYNAIAGSLKATDSRRRKFIMEFVYPL